MLRGRKRRAAAIMVVAAINKQHKKAEMLGTTLAWPQECIGCLQHLVAGAAHTSAMTTMAFLIKNLLKSCWKIEPRSTPSNIATRYAFFLKSAFTLDKNFIALFFQQSCSMILRGTLRTDKILRQELFCKKLNSVQPALAEFSKWRKLYNDYTTVSLATELPLSSQLALLRVFFFDGNARSRRTRTSYPG